ncbi:unnamed protein product [Enterobius vermicularis]|uniref:Flocculation protein FLO11-like n=1 Tax=Enterobius vermicularis TaxID=51028 RepID=A0A0N4V9A3_ENTVE|nr:unnamed protein product [Enterobius vermicularis]
MLTSQSFDEHAKKMNPCTEFSNLQCNCSCSPNNSVFFACKLKNESLQKNFGIPVDYVAIKPFRKTVTTRLRRLFSSNNSSTKGNAQPLPYANNNTALETSNSNTSMFNSTEEQAITPVSVRSLVTTGNERLVMSPKSGEKPAAIQTPNEVFATLPIPRGKNAAFKPPAGKPIMASVTNLKPIVPHITYRKSEQQIPLAEKLSAFNSSMNISLLSTFLTEKPVGVRQPPEKQNQIQPAVEKTVTAPIPVEKPEKAQPMMEEPIVPITNAEYLKSQKKESEKTVIPQPFPAKPIVPQVYVNKVPMSIPRAEGNFTFQLQKTPAFNPGEPVPNVIISTLGNLTTDKDNLPKKTTSGVSVNFAASFIA